MTLPDRVALDWKGRPVELELAWHRADRSTEPLLVFLHEGLGSVSMWRDFPARLCGAAACRGLVYSRPGYGRSTPRCNGEAWGVDYMHRQAWELLPALLHRLEIDTTTQPPWLLGHSDGGSIALLFASRFARAVAGVIALAPHILVEDLSVASIAQAREAYAATDLRQRLARHHDDPDGAFFGWNDIWLHPDFRSWTIEAELDAIRCPVLAIQGLDDEYGTLEQIHGIARRVPQTRTLVLPECGHSAHRDQPEAVIDAVAGFIAASR